MGREGRQTAVFTHGRCSGTVIIEMGSHTRTQVDRQEMVTIPNEGVCYAQTSAANNRESINCQSYQTMDKENVSGCSRPTAGCSVSSKYINKVE